MDWVSQISVWMWETRTFLCNFFGPSDYCHVWRAALPPFFRWGSRVWRKWKDLRVIDVARGWAVPGAQVSWLRIVCSFFFTPISCSISFSLTTDWSVGHSFPFLDSSSFKELTWTQCSNNGTWLLKIAWFRIHYRLFVNFYFNGQAINDESQPIWGGGIVLTLSPGLFIILSSISNQ